MYKKLGLGLLIVLALALGQIVAVSAAEPAKPVAKTEAHKEALSGKPMMHHRAANEVAVCGCGKVFVPNASTSYVTYEGKDYACCSEECHKKATENPAGAAKAAEEQMQKLTNPGVTPEKK